MKFTTFHGNNPDDNVTVAREFALNLNGGKEEEKDVATLDESWYVMATTTDNSAVMLHPQMTLSNNISFLQNIKHRSDAKVTLPFMVVVEPISL